MHRFLGPISDLIDRHNTDAVLLAEAVVFFGKWLVGYDGVQLFHGRIGHKRDPAEFGMVCKKDHAVGILCNGFFGDVFLGAGIGKSALHGYTCAGHKSHGNVVGLQIIIDIRSCEGQGLAVQLSGNGNDIQVRIGCCLVENKQAVGQDRTVLICNKINQVQAGCTCIDIDGIATSSAARRQISFFSSGKRPPRSS